MLVLASSGHTGGGDGLLPPFKDVPPAATVVCVCVAFRGNCHRVLIVIEGGVWICFLCCHFLLAGPDVAKAVEGVFIALLRY